MTNTENTPAAPKPRARKAKAAQTEPASELAAEPTSVTTTAPPAPVTQPSRGIGRGILIGAIAASLVGGLALGGAGGFALATVAHHGGTAFAGQDGPGGPQGQNGGMPGRPPHGGMPGGGQGGGGQGGGGQNGGGQNGGPQDAPQDGQSQDGPQDDAGN
ncbi:MAG TPA: hypothetical protein VGO65_12460 [Pseudolysinimonas sp.]|nr:hypothetical protein [Pseudolysinimonas sp.]